MTKIKAKPKVKVQAKDKIKAKAGYWPGYRLRILAQLVARLLDK